MISPENFWIVKVFFIIVLVYSILSLIIGITTYCRISCYILNRHSGILTGKTAAKMFAIAESFKSAVRLSPKWIVMKGDNIKYKLDEKFCPTYLI